MMRRALLSFALLGAACRATPAPQPQPRPLASIPPADAGVVSTSPDAAAPAPTVTPDEPEEPEESPANPADAPEDLAATLDARPFAYLRRRTATTAMGIHWNDVWPDTTLSVEAQIFAVSLPGGPSLVCVEAEACWAFDGEMKSLFVPKEDEPLASYPYLTVVAVMLDKGRVVLQLNAVEMGEQADEAAPARKVDEFRDEDAPEWALPWIEWLGDLRDVDIVSGSRPTPYVFVAEPERGTFCVKQEAGYRCGAPGATGTERGDVDSLFSAGTLDFGPGIVAIERNERLSTDFAYFDSSSVLLFDTRDPELSWIATIPRLSRSRTRPTNDDLPILDVSIEWAIQPVGRGKTLDPRCFKITRARGSRALRYVADARDHEGVGVRKAKLPRFPKAKTVELTVPADELTGKDFAGRWSVGKNGVLERRDKCRAKRK